MDKQITVKVETLSGSFEETFEVDQKLQDVIDKAFLSLDVKPTPGEKWELRYDNSVLDPQTTLAENKIPDGAILTLSRDEDGGGR